MSYYPFVVPMPSSMIPYFRSIDDKSWYHCNLMITSPTTAVIEVYDIIEARGCQFPASISRLLRRVPIEGVGDYLKPLIEEESLVQARELRRQMLIEAEEREIRTIQRRIYGLMRKVVNE